MAGRFKTKTVHGKNIKRLVGSSTLKIKKKLEQRQLMKISNWKKYIEHYEVWEHPEGSVILIYQEKFREEGPLVVPLWKIKEFNGKIVHTTLADMNTAELTTIANVLGVPLRIIARLKRKELEMRERRAKRYFS